MTLTLRYAAHSDRGLIRDGNQDSVYAGPRLLAVADGMGGMAAGDVASNIVIGAMAPLDEDVPGDALVDALRSAVGTANQQLRDTVDANPQLEGMGTTLTATLFSGSKLGMVHIGDSRAYLLRNGEFAQITKDDTYVQMLVDEGRISAEEASSHPQRSLLTRALDGRDIDPEYSVRQVLPGDRYLICSDGLSGVVSAETIGDSLREYTDPQQCVERLVQLALRGGGPDNITVIIADATDQDIVEASPIVGGAAARDRGMATAADDSTPAARASALSAPRPPAPEEPATNRDDDPDRPRRPLRTVAMLAALLVILGGGLFAGWSYTQRQYYVGATDNGQLAVFRGVPGSGRRPRPVQRALDQPGQARRPHPGRPGAGQAGHPGQEPTGRGAPAGRADQRGPGQPQPEAGLPAGALPRHRLPGAGELTGAAEPRGDQPRRDRRAGRHRHPHAAHHTRRLGLRRGSAGRRPGGLPVARVTVG